METRGRIRLDGRVAVVTGGGGGLGRSYALLLASRGAKVVVNDLGGPIDGGGRDASPARAVVAEIEGLGGEAVANQDDVSTFEGANALIRGAVEAYGTVDALVCNAGILRDRSFRKMTPEDFEVVVRVHLLGTVYPAKAAFLCMREQGYGRIVVTTSAAGLYGNFGQTAYGAAKLGVVGFMNSLKLEGLKHGVLVNAISPFAATRMGAGVFPEEVAPLLKPELVAPLAAYLCSEACASTGDIIVAGAGSFRRVRLVEGRGLDFGAAGEVTPEMIAERYGEVRSAEGARTFGEAREAFEDVVAPPARG